MIDTRTSSEKATHDRHTACTAAWDAACTSLLNAVSPTQKQVVHQLLHGMHNGGAGLRQWVSSVALGNSILPSQIPEIIIEVYQHDPEAAPLHDCETCGIAIPVRPNCLYGTEADPDRVYFSTCPVCGGRTGLYMYFTHRADSNVVAKLRRRPR
jgi:hypothetical protein